MPAFGTDQWRVLSPYLDQALDIAPEERAAWLESVREQNPTLAKDLQKLLKEHHQLGDEGFLEDEAPPLRGAAPLKGQQVGAYVLESPIGQGGMGTVWLARRSDGRFEGRAAVKFLNVAFVGGAVEERFKREGSILARLAHPNIAHLIDAGVSATRQPYLILEYVEGKHIDAYCNDNGLSVEARIQLFLSVLAAVAHAHANLVVHRDIKPSNVLVTGDGQVKLLDFGIAKLLEEKPLDVAATALTREGERALSLAYAAPEQVTGGSIATTTDVYALGVLLYELLAEKHPAHSALQSPAELIKAIVDTHPPRPSEMVAATSNLRRTLRGDLDTIVGKALKKNPAERYPSVAALGDDLRRYLKHEPISARPDTLAYRAKKFARRNYLALALATVALIATVGGVIGTVIQARTARIERDFALRELSRAEAIRELDSFVLSEEEPRNKPLNDLLARAERIAERQQVRDDANRVERLMAIGSRYMDHFEYVKARRVLEQAYALARTLRDPSTRARTSCALATSLLYDRDFERAESLFQEGLNELREDAPFALDRVFCLSRGSYIALRHGHPNEAVSRAEAAQRALKQSPIQSEIPEVDGLITLATAYRNAGQTREASAAFEQASARLTALGYDETHRGQVLFTNWGAALLAWGRPLEAERVLHRAIALGPDNRPVEDVSPALLVNYSRALKEVERLDEAAKYAERAYDKSQAVGDQGGIRESLLLRAGAYRGLGDLDHSDQMLSELEPIMPRSLRAGQIGFAALPYERALTSMARGDAPRALDLANRAVAIAEASLKANPDGARNVPLLLLSRSDIELQIGDKASAGKDAERALKMSLDAAQPGTFSSKVGRAYLALGRALQAQGKREEANAAFRSAVEHLESGLGPNHSEARAARALAQPELPLR